MKNRIILSLAIVLGLSLASCSSPQPAQDTTAQSGTEKDTATVADAKHAEFNPGMVSNKEVPHALNLRDYLARVPGVIVDGYSVSIRGAGQPLYVIDGVQVGRSLSDVENLVNIQDIDYVEVVKSPSELAMYGRLGGNGVIRIFTKRGDEQ